MEKMKYSPLPWRYELAIDGSTWLLLDANDALVETFYNTPENIMRFIVRACNNYDEMRELLEETVKDWHPRATIKSLEKLAPHMHEDAKRGLKIRRLLAKLGAAG